MDELVDESEYAVVINDEEQYSMLPAGVPLPGGWRFTGFRGTEQECIEHVDAVWTDMRPLSLRRAMSD
jgi:MbtH protein